MTAAVFGALQKVGAFATDDYRAATKAVAISELGRLHRNAGKYLQFVGDWERELGGDLEEAYTRLLGQAPAVLIRVGDGPSQPVTISRRVYRVILDLEVHVFSNNLRSHEARVTGDVASLDGRSDPGTDQALADIRAILTDSPLNIDSIGEVESVNIPGGVIWTQTYAVRAYYRAAKQPVTGRVDAESVQANHTIPTAEPPEATRVTTLAEGA